MSVFFVLSTCFLSVSENQHPKRAGFANRHICFHQLTDQDILPAAYVNVTFCQIKLMHYKHTQSAVFKIPHETKTKL